MEWPVLGKRPSAAPTQQLAKRQRRRELRHWYLRMHLLLQAARTPEVLDEKIEAYFFPVHTTAFAKKYGRIPNYRPAGSKRLF